MVGPYRHSTRGVSDAGLSRRSVVFFQQSKRRPGCFVVVEAAKKEVGKREIFLEDTPYILEKSDSAMDGGTST